MANINKYWVILENLQLPVVGAPKDFKLKREERLEYNLKELQKTIKLTPEEVIESLLKDLKLEHLIGKETEILGLPNEADLYSLYALIMLKEITQNTNFASEAREDLISENHKSLIVACLEDVASFALKENLHQEFYKDKAALFKRSKTLKERNFYYLEFIIEIFASFVFIKPLYMGTSMDEVTLWYMAAIFSLFLAKDIKEYNLEQLQLEELQSKLQKMWLELSKKLYYRNLMLLYSTLPNNHKSRVHKEMLLRLWSKGGFMALLFAMVESQRNEEQPMEEMVARLVSQPSYSTKAQQSLLKQILQFLPASLKNKELNPHMGAGILSLRKLYDNKLENRDFLKNWLKLQMLTLMENNPENLVAMEWVDFTDLISLIYHIFCTSSMACLPSELLLPYLPVFIEIYSELLRFDNQETLKSHISNLILKILNNRSKEDLNNIIEYLAKETYPNECSYATINIKENPLNSQELKLTVIGDNDRNSKEDKINPLTSLVVILKQSSHNLLIYQIFIILLQLMPKLVLDKGNSLDIQDKPTNTDLLSSKEDLYNRVLIEFSQKYERKVVIIKALESLVQYPPLKPLIHDNISDLLMALQSVLLAYADNVKISSNEINNSVLMILLILIREIIESCCSSNQEDFYKNLFKPLKQLELQINDVNLKYQIVNLIKLIKGESPLSSFYDPEKNQFEEARSLIESKESYLQVEGLEKMIKLLKQRQQFAVENCHVITALALNTLKSPESYTFLNCVRLFVALVNVNEAEVLELLADEYLNDLAAMDYRLVIGEAILKVSRELGPLCYKHKTVLLNTFMSGCRSPLDEFRFSSFSNLSQMCRILTYQVHNYFQELLHLINCELTSGQYLPAKRAAVMVLSDLLAGMDNLFDYEDMLLPIYRLLKVLVSSEQNDEKIRLHASNGLQCLAEKCKELFRTALEQRPLEKEIKILGIRDQPRKSLKSHILEMN